MSIYSDWLMIKLSSLSKIVFQPIETCSGFYFKSHFLFKLVVSCKTSKLCNFLLKTAEVEHANTTDPAQMLVFVSGRSLNSAQ